MWVALEGAKIVNEDALLARLESADQSIALAGAGFERTKVRLTADPAAAGNRHRVVADGAFGRLDVSIDARPMAQNPKTSLLAPLSLVRAIESRGAALRIA